jgi:hypothetical protein
LPPYQKKELHIWKYAKGVKENYAIFFSASENLMKEILIFMNIVSDI